VRRPDLLDQWTTENDGMFVLSFRVAENGSVFSSHDPYRRRADQCDLLLHQCLPKDRSGRAMSSPNYSALIRTFNSKRTLASTLLSLAQQSVPPSQYVFVDSGSTDGTLEIAPKNSIIHHYRAKKFNYSESLNQGIAHIETPYTMVVSSHTSIANSQALEYALATLEENDDIAAAYFVQEFAQNMRFDLIGPKNFSGFNGVWNTCALYKTRHLRQRSFRPEVFSAEDQDWSNWAINFERKYIAKISGAGMSYNNPAGNSVLKSRNECLAVAIYVKTDMLRFEFLARTLYRAFRPVSSMRERALNMSLLYSLILQNISRCTGRD